MVERNLIAEGFVRNTLNSGGSVSGTQVVSIPEMNSLIDEDFSTTAVTLTGTFFLSLDADLGARWKLNRIELYTDEPNSLNFDMSVSVDNSEFFPITMTGSAGYWSGTVSGTTVSGAPRYLRYEQRAPADRLIQEWRAINDDTLVEFGTTGTQTEVQITDAPIGRPSDTVTELKLFNRFTSIADGFIFIDSTGNKGDDNFEVSLSPNGPWFGRNTQSSKQPDNLQWVTLDNSSKAFGARPRVVSANWFVPTTNAFSGMNQQDFMSGLVTITGVAYSINFANGSTKGWTTSGFSSATLDSGKLRGNSSTSTKPSFQLPQAFGDSAAVSPDSAPDISNGFRPFLADHYDTATVVLTNPGTVPISDWLEGPRLYWKSTGQTSFGIGISLSQSAISTTSGQLGNGAEQTFRFELGDVPTWSGIITALAVVPWTTATGIGLTGSMSSLEIFKDGIDKQDRLALEQELPISGSWLGFSGGSFTSGGEWRTVINTENVVKDKCI